MVPVAGTVTVVENAGSLGPESQPNVASGEYHRSIYFRFDP